MSLATSIEAPAEQQDMIRSPFREFCRRFMHNKVAVFSSLFILGLVLVAIFAPWIAPYDPMAPDWMALSAGPSAAHWFGTDEFGRDILSRVIAGSRISLYVGIVSVSIGTVFGVILGLVSGFYGGRLDTLIMRGCDVLFAFPGMLLAIAVVAILGPGLNNVIIAVAVFSVPIFARIVRGSALTLKNATYVDAARSLGARNKTLMVRHILPGATASIIVFFTMRIGTSIPDRCWPEFYWSGTRA